MEFSYEKGFNFFSIEANMTEGSPEHSLKGDGRSGDPHQGKVFWLETKESSTWYVDASFNNRQGTCAFTV